MKSILLVDDDRNVLTSLEDVLTAFGYQVIAKPEAESTFSAIKEGAEIDLVMVHAAFTKERLSG